VKAVRAHNAKFWNRSTEIKAGISSQLVQFISTKTVWTGESFPILNTYGLFSKVSVFIRR